MSVLPLLARGRLSDIPEPLVELLLKRAPREDPSLTSSVAALIGNVRSRGDVALREMAQQFDGAKLDVLEVPREAMTEALEGLDVGVRSALERAARNIRRYHEAQLPTDVVVDVEEGVRITQRWTALERVGVYAPGGSAAYSSSVLMGVVPAKAAGVAEVLLCSPPLPSGAPSVEVLAAAEIAGADRVFALGGVGAIAALAYGTASVPAVDAIVGPGNRWVTEAKRQVAGNVVIDSPAGPSEILVLADDTTDARLVALEMIAQAEHDPDAACVVVSTSARVASEVETTLGKLITAAPRANIIRQALLGCGAVLVVESIDEAVDFANRYAPEHASIMTAEAADVARRLRTAGTTFVGAAASVAFGDYLTGANHVLPTAGRARSFSGLSTRHFLRSHTIQEITAAAAAAMAEDVSVLATAEGLPGHVAAALARMPA